MKQIQLRNKLELRNRIDMTQFLLTGMGAGLLAGLFMAVLLLLYSASVGEGLFFPLQLMAGVSYGVDVILGGAFITMAGLIVHLLVSAGLGAAFAVIFRPENRFSRFQLTQKQLILNGCLFGVAVWAIMTYVALPLFNPTMRDRVSLMPAVWFFVNVMFGVTLGALPSMLRALSGRALERVTVTEVKSRRAA
jgi:hypothetical protein